MTSRVLKLFLLNSTVCRRNLHTSSNLSTFFETKKSGYKTVYDRKPADPPKGILNKLSHGWRRLKKEFSLFGEEMMEYIRADASHFIQSDETEPVWKFDGTPESRDQWILTCDSDYGEGYSTAQLELSAQGTGIFFGTLNNSVPKDGIIKSAGYCNITTVPQRKSFMRPKKLDWSDYNYLVLRVRGDGRAYMLNICTKGQFDMTWNDIYHYVLFTRGGPYWQIEKIPFSKFFFGSKGAVQDKQMPVCVEDVTNFGITISDNISGPFRLEIDYIGLMWSGFDFEESSYETYNTGDTKW